VESVANAFDQRIERRFVAVHRLLDECPIHSLSWPAMESPVQGE
jgi:hypothetical protein